MIGERNPLESIEDLLPWLNERVICLECRTQAVLVRPVGTDYRTAKCSVCGARNMELEAEAAWALVTIH